jgi:hypothetical protein
MQRGAQMSENELDAHSVERGFMLAISLLFQLGVDIPDDFEYLIADLAAGRRQFLTAGEIISNVDWSHGSPPKEPPPEAMSSPETKREKAEIRQAAAIIARLMGA